MSPSEPPGALSFAVERLDELVASFEQDADEAVRERAIALLQAVDAVHRPGLTRLAAYLDAAGPGLREQALADPAIRLLFELYELLPAESAPPSGFVPLSEIRVHRSAGGRG